MNRLMKRLFFVFLILSAALVSCKQQDEVYKEFVKEGGLFYPAKPIELSAISGFQRVRLEWQAPMDPSIRATKLYWDNYTDSLVFSSSDYVDGVLSVWVDDLADRSYTFDVVNFDAAGHKSLSSEITTTPFGESWLLSHAERTILSARIDDEDALVTMTRATDEMVATQFRYKNTDGETVVSDWMEPEEVSIILPKALKGKRFEYRSAYLPKNGIDTVWSVNWVKSPDPFVYRLPTSTWTVTVTEDQEYESNTCEKIFDGIAAPNNRWIAARRGTATRVFPKILSIDTGMGPGTEYTFTEFAFYQEPTDPIYRYIKNVSLYIGSDPYDPNDPNASSTYGKPTASVVFTTDDEITEIGIKPYVSGRYFSVVFLSSHHKNGYIDLWELVPYGYLASDVD